MNKDTEIKLIKHCLSLCNNNTTKMADSESTSPVERYINQEQFEQEQEKIFRRKPVPYAHSSQVSDPNSFITLDSPLGALLITRDEEGIPHAFYNVCRHRGTKLVKEGQGCAKRFRCAYHAWTYTTKGDLSSVPHGESCFPSLEREKLGLKELPCVERHGFIWVFPVVSSSDIASDESTNKESIEKELDHYLLNIEEDISWLTMDKLEVFTSTKKVWNTNWKIIAEGGLETYHFRFAHKNTIAPYFMDNVSTYDQMGAHFRTILPRSTIKDLENIPEDDWLIRNHSHITYALFPQTTFLVQHEHVDWVHANPIAPDRTEITIFSLVPKQDKAWTEEEKKLWQLNHDITNTTLDEDFEMAESIQLGLKSGANKELNFGLNEGALAIFNKVVDDACAEP